MADTVEARWQDMEEKAADELARFEAQDFLAVAAPGTPLGPVVLPPEGDGLGVGDDG
jgi:hypothetical protein